ncbi:MAG: thymidylate synthase [Loktanella sp.]|nr:thymidylate synthase [Loktanella sp.]
MIRFFYAMMSLTFVAACDAVGEADAPPEPAPPMAGITVPAPIANNLSAASLADGSGSLTVSITLDAGVVEAVYARNAAYDLPGYLAFTTQDDRLDRFFTGFAAQSADGSARAAVVADGGQFTKFFGGATYEQTGTYTAPTEGLVTYAGTYAGLINLSTRQGTAPAPGVNADILPFRSGRISGDVFLNASFATNKVNGAIYNRVYQDGTGILLDTVFLIPTEIQPNGAFTGVAEDRNEDGIGSYGGTFGGVNASSVAGAIRLDGDFVPGTDIEDETGIFVLGRCGTAGVPSICEPLNDL